MKSQVGAVDYIRDYQTELETIQATFKPREFTRWKPKSDFPELIITVPDKHDELILAPVFDAHLGSTQHDEERLLKDLNWISETPNVLSWNGGDATENITNSKMGHTTLDNEEQILLATQRFGLIQHKLMWSHPGNHEDRTRQLSGVSSGRRIADNLKVPYFTDYCFATIKWRGNNFRILSHHGAGGATTAGAQRNSARKELVWHQPDILWTGHLHQPLTDTILVVDHDQESGRLYERESLVIISPSYLKYFGGYAAKFRLAPGKRGLSAAILQSDGRIDANIHARGKRI
jgi:hypothetical protein